MALIFEVSVTNQADLNNSKSAETVIFCHPPAEQG
jgi:hypothetical protein